MKPDDMLTALVALIDHNIVCRGEDGIPWWPNKPISRDDVRLIQEARGMVQKAIDEEQKMANRINVLIVG